MAAADFHPLGSLGWVGGETEAQRGESKLALEPLNTHERVPPVPGVGRYLYRALGQFFSVWTGLFRSSGSLGFQDRTLVDLGPLAL